jgi:hypothetical protein
MRRGSVAAAVAKDLSMNIIARELTMAVAMKPYIVATMRTAMVCWQ